MNPSDLLKIKKTDRKLTMVTCYDAWSAQILEKTDVDLILVGDSVAMVVYGHSDTTKATLPMMTEHVAAVRRGAPTKFIVGDMPFLSFRKSLNLSLEAAGELIRAGANAVKFEGADGNLELTKRLSESGVPVMGHLGLTPQFVNAFGGFKVQGRTKEAQEKIIEDALALEKAGAFSVVLECVPASLSGLVRRKLSIPVIGIGAGADCDGQVLVLQDMLGFFDKTPRFVRRFAPGKSFLTEAVQHFCEATQSGEFPNPKESYE